MPNLVEIRDLKIGARTDSGREVQIIKGVSIDVAAGEIVALIGESGSGKTTIALSLMGHVRPGCYFQGGSVTVAGRDMAALRESERAKLRGTDVAYVPQSAAAAFNPAIKLIDQVVEVAKIHNLMPMAEARVIACVLETIRDPDGFIGAVTLAREKGVPVVVLKLGRSAATKQFAISHSGALSGSNAGYDAVFARHGVIQVRSLDELLDTAELMALRRVMPAAGIALGTDPGGERQLISIWRPIRGCPSRILRLRRWRRLRRILTRGWRPRTRWITGVMAGM